ncbi:hypothetical protein HDV00_011261, partial [Rhizophlyctis rosea]
MLRGTSRTTNTLVPARLLHDLRDIHLSPLANIDVHLNKTGSLSSFCAVLTPPEGPFKDLRLHFVVHIPANYPQAGPNISISTPVTHPNVFGEWICCDILKGKVVRQGGYVGGYTPAYTLQTILIQLLSFFTAEKVDQDYGNAAYVIRQMPGYNEEANKRTVLNFKCKSCGYGIDYPQIVGMPVMHTTKEKPKVSWSTNEQVVVPLTGNSRSRRAERRRQVFGTSGGTSGSTTPMEEDSTTSAVLATLAEELATPMEVDQESTASPKAMKCWLPILDSVTDIWLLIAEKYLGDDDIRTLSRAYYPFALLTKQAKVLHRRDLRCFYLRHPFTTRTILGVGVNRKDEGNPRAPKKKYTLNSEFDLLSIEAFRDHGVSAAVWGEPFNAFLPLVLDEQHYLRAKGEIEKAVMWLAGKSGGSRSIPVRGIPEPYVSTMPVRFEPWTAVEVISKMMNQMVVNLMKNVESLTSTTTQQQQPMDPYLAYLVSRQPRQRLNLHASDKALSGYCSLLHLLLRLALDHPSILETAHNRVHSFLSRDSKRQKDNVPDLGEFLVLLALVPGLTWEDLKEAVLKELLARNVVWYCKERPYLAWVEDRGAECDEVRCKETFEGSKTSLRLLMFQVYFLRSVVGAAQGGGGKKSGETGKSGESSKTSQSGPRKGTTHARDEEDGFTTISRKKRETIPSPTTNPTTTQPYNATQTTLLITRAIQTLAPTYGLPSPRLSASLASKCRSILLTPSFSSFLEQIHMPASSTATQAGMLRSAVRASLVGGYHHSPYWDSEMYELWRVRLGGRGMEGVAVPRGWEGVRGRTVQVGRNFFP